VVRIDLSEVIEFVDEDEGDSSEEAEEEDDSSVEGE